MKTVGTVMDVVDQLNNEVKELENEPELLKEYWFDLSANTPEQESVLKQGDLNILSRENFSCIIGLAKVRKSTLVGAMIGAYLCPDEFLGLSGVQDDGRVLYVDTEQSRRYVKRFVRRIHHIAGFATDANNERLRVLTLKGCSTQEQWEYFLAAIEEVKPTFCVIDGIADFMDDTNSLAEAKQITNKISALTKKYHCHILTVLHTNPGSDKARGHIGGDITRQAETVIHVSKDGDTSRVKPAYCKDIDFEEFAFIINGQELPELIEIQNQQPKTLRLATIFAEVLPLPCTMSYADLVNKIMVKADVKESMSKRKIKYALDKGVIEKNSIGYYHLKQKNINDEKLEF